jgi:hypothetical protein
MNQLLLRWNASGLADPSSGLLCPQMGRRGQRSIIQR